MKKPCGFLSIIISEMFSLDMRASQKKSLAGLDSTQTDGVTAFTALDEATNKLCSLGMDVLLLKNASYSPYTVYMFDHEKINTV